MGTPFTIVLALGAPATAWAQLRNDPALVAHWAFDEGRGTLVRDVTGHRHDGTVEGAKWSPEGLTGSALLCDGGAVVVPASGALTPSEQLTVELWFKTDKTDQNDQWLLNTIMGDDSRGYRLGFSVGELTFQVLKSSWSHLLRASLPTPAGRWCHAVGTYDGEWVRLYLNGLLVGRLQRGGDIRPSGQPLVIGSYVAGHPRAFFEGLIDEVSLYSRALTGDEVVARYALLAPGGKPDTWAPWSGVDLLGREGDTLRVRLSSEAGLLVSPPMQVRAEERPWAAFRLKADRGSLVQVGWATGETPAFAYVSVPLVADNEFHTYNVDLSGQPGWSGTVTNLALRPSNAAGAVAEFTPPVLVAEPSGPAELHLRWCGLEDALNRVGMTCRLLCQVENRGGRPARNVTLTARLPGLLAAEPPGRESRCPRLEPAEVALLALPARAVRAGEEVVKLTLSADECPSLERDLAVTIGPRLAVEPTLVEGKPYVPEPQPVETDYEIGAYIFPGWKEGVHYGWQRIMPWPEKRPVLGWYREERPEVADWWIKWALEHGVTFLCYDWYWYRGSRSLEHGLHEAFLNARYQDRIKFALLWANHNPPIATPEEAEQDLLAVTDYWIEHYFRRANYLRVDGKPVVFIFSPWHFTNDLKGSANVKRVMDLMRERCREQGLGGLYLVNCTSTGSLSVPVGEVRRATEEGWDAVSTYAWVGYDRKYIPFSEAAAGYRESWQAVLDNTPLKMIVPLSGGFDSRPWHAVPTIRYDRTPEAFRRHLEEAKALMDADMRPPAVKMAIVEAWNEWGEGAYIEPNTEWGFGYLDAIRRVFTQAPEPHDDLTPRDVGLGPYDWDFTPRTAWEFNEDGKGEGWGAMMGLAEARVEGGFLQARTVSDDSAFAGSCDTDARAYPAILLRMRIDKGEFGQLFWSGTRTTESEAASVHFPLIADGEFHEYRLAVAENPLWRGRINRLRLDPNAAAGAQVAIDSIRLLANR